MCGVVKRAATDSCNILFQRVTNLIVLLNRTATFRDSHTNLGWTPWIITIIIVCLLIVACVESDANDWWFSALLQVRNSFFCCHSGSDFNVINTLFFASRYCPHIFAMFSLSHLFIISKWIHMPLKSYVFDLDCLHIVTACSLAVFFVSYSSNNWRQRKRENEGMNIGSRFCVTVSL